MGRATRSVFAGLILGLLLPSCGNRSGLLRAADELLSSFATQDYAAFERVTSRRLALGFKQPRFRQLAAALQRLGKLEGRALKSDAVRAGGADRGVFELRYAKGAVRLSLTLRQKKVVAFALDGVALKRALRLQRQGFLVEGLRLLDVRGKPRQAFGAGDPVIVELAMAGLKKAHDGKVGLKVDLRVLGPNGQPAMVQPQLIDAVRPAPPEGQSAVFAGRTTLPRGKLQLDLLLMDPASGRRLHRSVGVVVGPPHRVAAPRRPRPRALTLPPAASGPTHDPAMGVEPKKKRPD